MYGYSARHIPLPSPGVLKDSVKVTTHPVLAPQKRPGAVRLPISVAHAAPPLPDTSDPANKLIGCGYRLGKVLPKAKHTYIRKLKSFVQTQLPLMFPDRPREYIDFNTWIENTNYTRMRKDTFRKMYENNAGKKPIEIIRVKKNKCVKSFVKEEFYPSYKYPRGIYSRTDEFKMVAGPVFKTIENIVFKYKAFIKKIPVELRPEYIEEMMNKYVGPAMATDYSSFEGSFTSELMEAVEFVVYDYFTELMSDEDKQLMREIKRTLSGTNVLKFKELTVEVEATRMSGEMNTSLGNSITNLFVMLFLCHENGTQCEGVIEGDDALFKFADWSKRPRQEQYADLGFNIKIDEVQNHNEASFCGLVYDVVDLTNITEPFYLLCKIGWGNRKYVDARPSLLKSLLRSKALSIQHQYPHCPILSALAYRVLKDTAGCTVSDKIIGSYNLYEQEEIMASLGVTYEYKSPKPRTRLLMEKVYGIPIAVQTDIEEYIMNTEDEILNIPHMSIFVDSSWYNFYSKYVTDTPPEEIHNFIHEDVFFGLIDSRQKPKWW